MCRYDYLAAATCLTNGKCEAQTNWVMGALSESGQNSGSSVYQWPRGKWIIREKTIQSLCLFWIPLYGVGHNARRLLCSFVVKSQRVHCVSLVLFTGRCSICFYALRLSSVFACTWYKYFYYCTSLILFFICVQLCFSEFLPLLSSTHKHKSDKSLRMVEEKEELALWNLSVLPQWERI